MEKVVALRPEYEQCVRDGFVDMASGIWQDKAICVF